MSKNQKIWLRLIALMLVTLITLGTFTACGVVGEAGPAGPQGIQGEKGDKGDKGDTGDTGAQGLQGEKGDKGDTGDTGAQGLQGEKGEKGDTGDTGAQGLQGDKGDTGDTGDTGAQGPQGEKGDTGAQGPQGEKGDPGAQGPQGEKGDPGVATVSAFDIAKTFGYKGDYGEWVTEIIKGDLSVQYPVTLSEDLASFTYGWSDTIVTLGEHAFLLDSRLSDELVAENPYLFNNVNAAIEAATDGTEEDPMVIYIAPGVYWTHDPDQELTENAYTVTKRCANMHWEGLTDDYRNVVIAFNFGHNRGYMGGNPTCFNISGNGFNVRNLTVGGYCNVDLVYHLNHDLDHEKRTTDVTQCQLGSYSGDKLYCENVAFISRLNMMPFLSNSRALYVNCHLESTDDSLNGSSQAVYIGCDFEFYASKPWGGASGVTLIDCDLNITHINVGNDPHQYLAKMAGRFNVIDCRFHDDTGRYNIGWSDILSDTYRSYYSNVTYNGNKIDFSDGGKYPDQGVDITGTEALKAYKLVTEKGKVVYNIYGLLRGNDDWDPLGQKDEVTALGGLDIARNISASVDKGTIETGKEGQDVATLRCSTFTEGITWFIKEADKAFAVLTVAEDGTVTLTAANESEESVKIIVTAKHSSGLEAAVVVTVKPSILPISAAADLDISQSADGKASVSYTISDLGARADQSRINWYVCDDAEGTNPIHVATGRGTEPLKTLVLHPAWVGKFLMVEVESKHIRSNYGEKTSYVSPVAISPDGIASLDTYDVDIGSFVTSNNANILPGYWTVRSMSYGTGGKNGFLDYTGIFFTGSKPSFSETNYTPVAGEYGDMDVTIKAAPGKTAGQGFGSNNNFIEVRIKYDEATGIGYAARIVRTSGDSTKVQLVKLSRDDDGAKVVEVLAESGNTSAYLTECTIRVWTADGKLNVHVESSEPQKATALDKGYLAEVDLSAEIEANTLGGFGVYYESSTGDNTTYISSISIQWN